MDELEQKVKELVAMDRIYRPLSSMAHKLEKRRPKLARAIDLSKYKRGFVGERFYARLETDDKHKAKGMREGIAKFVKQFPREGKILEGYIAEQRKLTETQLYFGVNDGCKLTADDYMAVMADLGFSPVGAKRLYPELMNVSRNLARRRKETERSILYDSKIA